MNFPAGAPEFLDTFHGLYSESEEEEASMPIIHCYCFVKSKTEKKSAQQRTRKALFGDDVTGQKILPNDKINVREVRDVAPNKIQVCVTFQLPREVAFGTVRASEEPSSKRQKTS